MVKIATTLFSIFLTMDCYATCSTQLTSHWSESFKSSVLVCENDSNLRGAYVLSRQGSEGIRLGFFKINSEGKLETAPAIVENWVGHRLLKIKDNGREVNYVYRDLNGDRKKDFVFSALHDFSGVFRGVSLGNSRDTSFTQLFFDFSLVRQSNAVISEFYHSDALPVEISRNNLRGVVRQVNLGIVTLENNNFSISRKTKRYVLRSVVRRR